MLIDIKKSALNLQMIQYIHGTLSVNKNIMSYNFNLNKVIRFRSFCLIFLLRLKVKNKVVEFRSLIFRVLNLSRKPMPHINDLIILLGKFYRVFKIKIKYVVLIRGMLHR